MGMIYLKFSQRELPLLMARAAVAHGPGSGWAAAARPELGRTHIHDDLPPVSG